jgi:hypothetical protein
VYFIFLFVFTQHTLLPGQYASKSSADAHGYEPGEADRLLLRRNGPQAAGGLAFRNRVRHHPGVGKTTLELVDEAQALSTDRLEASASDESTPVRFSFRVSEPVEVAYGLLRREATLAAPPGAVIPGEAIRLKVPDGPAFSVFSAPAGPASARDDGTIKGKPGPGSVFKLLCLYK